MKLIVQGKQMRVSAALRRFAEEHVVRPLRRFYDNEAAELRVEVGRDNGNRGESKECHLTLRMPGTRTIQIEESTPDVYACLDLAADRLVRVAKKELSKQRRPKGRHKHHPLATVVAEGGVPGGLVEDLPNGRALRGVERQLSGRRRRK
ncbi:MAG TPA: ribosome-associated translation inhibitor RaiA [Myxococcales bacterium]|nr:ribosome-associated translation inhibitor RaiA [Myxococcales bacterium]